MGFLTKEGLQNLTNKLVQGDAIKVASHRGKNVKEVIDNIQRECENVALPNTMTLENRISEFKVGQGRDVDVSGDVEEGKIEVELEGKTYQNLAYSTQYLFNTNRLECFTVERDKNNNHVRVVAKEDMTSGYMYFNCGQVSKTLIKPNTTYTAIIKKNPTVTNMRLMLSNGDALNISAKFSDFDSLGRCKFVTNDMEDSTRNIIYINNKYSIKKGDAFEIEDLIILEGDHAQNPIEELPNYFEGIKSSFEDGIVDIEVQGKNLFDNSKIRNHSLISFDGEYVTCVSDGKGYQIFNNTDSAKLLKPNKTYYVSVNVIENTLDSTFEVQFGVGEGRIENAMPKLHSYIDSKFTGVKKITGVTQSDLKGKNILDCRMVSNSKSGYIRFKIMITEVENEKFEPYYKKKISFNIEEPLRSLPNGVCDEIRNNNGQWELVKRVGKLVFDGTENWVSSGTPPDDTNFKRFDLTLSNTLKKGDGVKLLCNNLPHIYIHSLPNGSKSITQECISNHSVDINTTNVVMKTSTIGGTSVTNFKQYLSNNPLVVYYELQSPIITPIDPIEFDISQGAVININSDISPTSTHKVILNRAGQIEQSIELIANLKSRINELENIYDSNLIATQYRLNNLKLNYELEREED